MKIINKLYLLLFVVIGFTSCQLDEVANPNNPTRESLIQGASQNDLQFLTTGLESVMRNDMEYYYWTTSSVGREYYDLRETDPRYTGELLGINGSSLDNNGFLTTRAFAQVYRVARQANDLILSVDNSSTALSQAELDAIKGIANTYKAYSLGLELNRQYENGLRFDVADADNPGPFLGYTESLAEIRSLLDTAIQQVSGASSLPVDLNMIGLSSVSDVVKFQNGLAARIAMYQNDKPAMRSYLSKSFLSLSGNLDNGVYFPFGTSGNDIANPMAYGTSKYMAHPSFEADAEAGDNRVDEKTFSTATVTSDGITADRIVALYATNVTPVPLMRNEELILMYAEANIGFNNAEALRALNIVRNAAGLANVSWTSDADLVNELLKQRRYSLFGEGHRWVDMRRYNRLNQLPLDRTGDVVHTQFPRPQSEG